MTEVSFGRVKQLLGELRSISPEQHDAHLDQACGDDQALRREVESLMAEAERQPAFLREAAAGPARLFEITTSDGLAIRDSAQPVSVNGYRILRRIGTGGMGAVYEAEQDNPRRRVAFKMIRAGLVTRETLQRFRREAELLGRLQHPGIAQIYEAGTADLGDGDQPYFAMELVEGRPLTTYANEQRLDTAGRLRLFAAVCDAVHHAHLKGVVHRDLKPDNILVTEQSTSATGTAVAHGSFLGQPKVLDFGIARATDPASQLITMQTHTGQLVGTLPYMSPEQVLGDGTAIGVRSDVYSLGVLLFELLGQRLPYDLRGQSIPEAARIIREENPDRLASIDTVFQGDLETIVAKALEKEPQRRYGSAAELAADILRHLHHEPITARKASSLYQLRKFARRNKAIVIGTGVAFLALIIGLAFSIRFGLREAHERSLREEREAEARFATYRAQLGMALIAQDPAVAVEALAEAPAEYRGWEYDWLSSRVAPLRFNYQVDVLSADVEPTSAGDAAGPGQSSNPVPGAVAFRAATPIYIYAGTDGLHLVDLETETSRLIVPGLGHVRALALSSDGSHLAAIADQPARLIVWRLTSSTAEQRLQRDLTDNCDIVALSSHGERVAIQARDREARVFDLASGETVMSFALPLVAEVAELSPDGSQLALGNRRDTLWLADAEGESRLTFATRALAYGPNGRRIVSSGEKGLRLHPLDAAEPETFMGNYTDIPLALAFSHDGVQVASATRDRVSVWNAQARKRLSNFAAPAAEIARGHSLAFNPSNEILLARTNTGACAWALGDHSSLTLEGELPYVYEAVFSPDGQLVAAAGGGGEVRIWDALSGASLAVLPTDLKTTFALAFSQDGSRLIAASGKLAHVWDPALGLNSREDVQRGGEAPILSVPKGAWFDLSGGGSRITSYEGFRQWVVSSRDGQRLLRGTERGFELIDRATGGVLASPSAASLAQSEVSDKQPAVALSPDESGVATGYVDGSIALWDLATGDRRVELSGHGGLVYSLDYSPDGTRLVSGSRDGTLQLWDVEHSRSLLVLRGHDDYVHSVRFSPDGTRIVSSSGDGSVRIWDARPLTERRRAEAQDATRVAALRPRVRQLIEKLGTGIAVAAQLRADAMLSEAELGTALRLLLQELSDP